MFNLKTQPVNELRSYKLIRDPLRCHTLPLTQTQDSKSSQKPEMHNLKFSVEKKESQLRVWFL